MEIQQENKEKKEFINSYKKDLLQFAKEGEKEGKMLLGYKLDLTGWEEDLKNKMSNDPRFIDVFNELYEKNSRQ